MDGDSEVYASCVSCKKVYLRKTMLFYKVCEGKWFCNIPCINDYMKGKEDAARTGTVTP